MRISKISCLTLGLLAIGISLHATPEGDAKAFDTPFYTGKILPSPQSATYSNEYASLSKTGILLGKGIDCNDPKVKLLINRIFINGGKAETTDSFSEQYSTIVSLGENDLEKSLLKKQAPEKREGYLIYHERKGKSDVIVLKGHDNLGLLWAIVSFNQLVFSDAGKPVVRKAEVYDFPATAARGCFMDPWSNSGSDWAWFCVQAKLNTVKFTTGKIYGGNSSNGAWREEYSDDYKAELRKIGDFLNPLGITWYNGICPIRGKAEDKLSSKSENDFNSVFRNCCAIAEAGGNIFILYDDTRFPLSPSDEKEFGSAREADIYFLNKLYASLKGKYPAIKMSFCPPFYWGPAHNPNYTEGRDEYLRALGSRLPKEIGIVWTGPSVNSSKITREELAWIANIIKRKPDFWQNGMGAPHAYGYHYVTDPLNSWSSWYYEGFFNDLECYALASNPPMNCAALLTMSDALWNPAAYDASSSVEEAASKLAGPQTYPALQKMNTALSYFDKYALRVSPGAAKNISEIREKVKELESAWVNCLKYNPAAVRKWTSLERHLGQQKNFLKALEGNPDLASFIRNIEIVKEIARNESNFNQESDVFLSAYDFLGGGTPKLYSFRCEPRVMSWIYGRKTNLGKMTAAFSLPVPPTSDYSLVICGQDNDSGKRCGIRITINNNKIFEGDNPFERYAWSRYDFPVKGSFLKEGANTVSIENTEDSDVTSGPPFFMLNYGIIRKP